MNKINVSSYRFVSLAKQALPELRDAIKARAIELNLKGTVLLSQEGINLFISGYKEEIESFQEFLNGWEAFRDLWFKLSPSQKQPFTRMLVRIKKEIIAMGHDEIEPAKETAPYVQPKQLKEWYDSGKDMVILDTRNDYEVRIGTFENAVDLNIHTFREFPKAIEKLAEEAKDKTVVTFCTGGIRCEKAAEFMKRKGFSDVYQLEGGILNYFEQCGGDHYDGECFVFDKRVAVDPELKETATKQCYACREPLSIDEQSEDEMCPHCGKNINGKRFYAHLPKSEKQKISA